MSPRRRQHGLERVLGTRALFSTAYGDVGSSIYYALGLTASFALGLTPVVFVIAGLFFIATALTYAEGTVRFPEAGGSSSFARHAFNEVFSFGAAWAQMLNYLVTISISAFFVPHYLSVFWGPLRTNPWDIVGGAAVIAILVALNVFGIREATRLNVVLALVDFSTQVLLVLLGAALIFNPHVLAANVHFGLAPRWSAFFLGIPIAMIAYTGMETISNLAEETRDPARDVPRAYKFVAGAVFTIYLTLPAIALMAVPVRALHAASRLAAERRSRLVLLAPLEVPLGMALGTTLLDEQERRLEDLLDESAAIAGSYGVRTVPRLVRTRSAAGEILAEAGRQDAEIVILEAQTRPRRRSQRLPLEEIVEQVVKRATCRVMLVSGPSPQPRRLQPSWQPPASEPAELEAASGPPLEPPLAVARR
jgi:nucleotide-binding universal stress UspA family protein